MIEWSKYFDKIYCICYNKSKFRKQLLQFELNRVGILNSGIFEWQITFQDQYLKQYKNLYDIFNFNNAGTLSQLSCTKGHINAIKKSYYEGYNRILLLEDDVRFLKDLNKIEEVLQNIPNDIQWEVIMFNKELQPSNKLLYFNTIKNKKNLINKHYCKFNDLILFCSTCYSLNKQGMQRYLSFLDSNYITFSDMFWNDSTLSKNIYEKKITSIKNICVQVSFYNSMSNNIYNSKSDYLHSRLTVQGVDFNDYMMRKDGSKFKYGDYIEE